VELSRHSCLLGSLLQLDSSRNMEIQVRDTKERPSLLTRDSHICGPDILGYLLSPVIVMSVGVFSFTLSRPRRSVSVHHYPLNCSIVFVLGVCSSICSIFFAGQDFMTSKIM
jgi:hypothetical protein